MMMMMMITNQWEIACMVSFKLGLRILTIYFAVNY